MSMEKRIRKNRINLFFENPTMYLEVLTKESIQQGIPFLFTQHGQIYSDDHRIDNLIAEVVRDYEYLVAKKYPNLEQEMLLDDGEKTFYIKKTIIDNELKAHVVEIPQKSIDYTIKPN